MADFLYDNINLGPGRTPGVFVQAFRQVGVSAPTLAGVIPVDGTITEVLHVCEIDDTGGAGALSIVITDSVGGVIQIVELQAAPIVENESRSQAVSIPVSAGDMVFEILQGVSSQGTTSVTVKVEV